MPGCPSHSPSTPLGRAEWVLITNDDTLGVEDAAVAYKSLLVIEIVFTQMTKTDVLALRAERDHVADLHLSVGHHHPVDEKLHELALLLEGSLSEPSPYPCAKRFDRADPAGKLRLMIHLGFQLLGFDLQGLKPSAPAPGVGADTQAAGSRCRG
jgi:hypothetical protein